MQLLSVGIDIHLLCLSFLANVTARVGGLQTEVNITSQGREKVAEDETKQ